MKKQSCELCANEATMYCESDEASLCWDCDAKVHCANFLVAKHSRTLLCHSCQAPTPWSASGPKLAPTTSFCSACQEQEHSTGPPGDDYETETDDDQQYDDDNDDDENDDGDEEDVDNQVVPLSSSPPIPSSPRRLSRYGALRDYEEEYSLNLNRQLVGRQL